MSVRRTIVVGGTTILLLGSFIIHGSLTGWQLHQGALDYITGNDVKKQIILLQKQVDAQQAIIDELKGAPVEDINPLDYYDAYSEIIYIDGIAHRWIWLDEKLGLFNEETQEELIMPIFTEIGVRFEIRGTKYRWVYIGEDKALMNVDTYELMFPVGAYTRVSDEFEVQGHYYRYIYNGDKVGLMETTDGYFVVYEPDYDYINVNAPGDYELIDKAAEKKDETPAVATNPAGNTANPVNPANQGNSANQGTITPVQEQASAPIVDTKNDTFTIGGVAHRWITSGNLKGLQNAVTGEMVIPTACTEISEIFTRNNRNYCFAYKGSDFAVFCLDGGFPVINFGTYSNIGNEFTEHGKTYRYIFKDGLKGLVTADFDVLFDPFYTEIKFPSKGLYHLYSGSDYQEVSLGLPDQLSR